MADEFRITSKIRLINGSLKVNIGGVYTFDQNTAGGPAVGYLTIGTSEESVSLSELGTEGFAWFQNLDDTNYVQWGPDSGGSMVAVGRMKAGEVAGPFRLEPGLTLKMKANTAACKVLAYVFEN